MDDRLDIRWRQRLDNFSKSLACLEKALINDGDNIIVRAAVTHFYETTFELGWKCIKDYLVEVENSDLQSPRSILQRAFQIELITNNYDWSDALQSRNLLAHTYNEVVAADIEHKIRNHYYPMLRQLAAILSTK